MSASFEDATAETVPYEARAAFSEGATVLRLDATCPLLRHRRLWLERLEDITSFCTRRNTK